MAETTIQCGSACTVTLQLAPAPATPEHFHDLTDGWYLYFGAAIVIICGKKIVQLFDRAPHG